MKPIILKAPLNYSFKKYNHLCIKRNMC